MSSQYAYLLRQLVVWQRLSVHLGWKCDNVRAPYDEIPKSVQEKVFAGAKAFVKDNKDRYDCGGYIYTGEGQDLGQFWANLAVGNGKIQKSSSNTTITNGNDCYSLSGATFGIYSDKSCTKSVTTLMTDGNGNTDTLVELFKIDMETGKATAQGNASLEGAEFVWKYYDGYYTKDNLPSEQTRTWTTKTKAEKGSDNTIHYITRLTDSYKVSGDSFFTQNGTVCLFKRIF